MPVYLDTRGNSVLAVAICDRCRIKFPYSELRPDPNFPGMRVCHYDLDNFDPWRLPALQTENIALRFPRPDTDIATGPVGGQQLMTAQAPNGPIDSPVDGTRKPNNSNRDSVFITQTTEQSQTAGTSGDLTD